MNILIRVDSSNLIGSGHLMRCLTLAERQRKAGDNVVFVCRDLDGNLSNIVCERDFGLVLLPKVDNHGNFTGYAKWLTVTQQQDANDTIMAISTMEHINCVVVDSYAIDETWEKMIRPYTDEIFVIDDLANRVHDCDFLLDQDLYDNMEQRYNGLVPDHCKKMLGPRYALLREEFYKAREKQKKRETVVKNILVFYGGVDTTDETTKAIVALKDLRSELADVTVDVIVGASNARKNKLKAICEKSEVMKWIRYHEQVENIAEFMCKADLMLGAGGTTMWERCFLGLPAVVTAVADNQVDCCIAARDRELIEYLGVWNEVTIQDIKEKVCEFLSPTRLRKMQESIRRNFIDKL